MVQPRSFDAELYKIGNTVTVLLDGYAFETRNDASLEIIGGIIKATKFGLYEISPMKVQSVRTDAEKHGTDLYEEINSNTAVNLYNDGNYHYVEGHNFDVLFRQPEFAVYDRDDQVIYNPRYDEKEQNSFNLIGLSTDTIKKVESDVWEQNLYEKYQPIIRINKNSD